MSGRRNKKRLIEKAGRLFEEAVADTARGFGPNHQVSVGKWIDGPDGKRDMDVHITGRLRGEDFELLLECKDYDPKKTGKIGIDVFDKLDSKLRDLKIRSGAVVSNAGFTSDALHKAARLGLGAIGVLRQGDARVRIRVVDEVYTRRISIPHNGWQVQVLPPCEALATVPFEKVTAFGRPVIDWLSFRMRALIGMNPIVNGPLGYEFRFRPPLSLAWEGGAHDAEWLQLSVTLEGGWYRHLAEVDATAGYYNWLRKLVRIPDSGGSITYRSINLDGGELVKRPPDSYLNRKRTGSGEVWTYLTMLKGFPTESSGSPEIEALLSAEDRDSYIPDPTQDQIESSAALFA